MFFDWKQALEQEENLSQLLAAYVPEKLFYEGKPGGLIPAVGKAFSALGRLVYSKPSKESPSFSIRPNEAAFLLKGRTLAGIYLEGSLSEYEREIWERKGFRFLATASSAAAIGAQIAGHIAMPVAGAITFGAWITALLPVLKTGDYRLLLADTTPFEVDLPVGHNPLHPLITSDKERVQGEVHSLFQLDPTSSERLVALLGSRNYLTASHISQSLERDFIHRTLIPHVATISSSDLRTSPKIHQDLETFAKAGVEDYFAPFGVKLIRFTLSWELTEAEKRELSRKKLALEQAEQELSKEVEKRERERELKAELEEKKLSLEAKKGLRELDMAEAKDRLFQESELRKEILKTKGEEKQVEHHLTLEEKKREAELISASQEVEKAKLKCLGELERIKREQKEEEVDFTLEIDGKQHEHELQKQLREGEVKTKIAAMEDEQDLAKLEKLKQIEREDYLAIKEKEKELELREKELEIEARLKELELKSSLTADQLLALGAAESEGAAKALAEKYKGEREKTEEMMRKMGEMMEGQMGTVQQIALQYGAQMAEVAKAASGFGEASPQRVCGKCGGKMEAHWKVCPNCAN